MTKVSPQVAQMKKSDFPVTKKRSFFVEWIKHYPNIRYSIAADAVFCAECILFGDIKSPFVITGFPQWNNAFGTERGMITQHVN